MNHYGNLPAAWKENFSIMSHPPPPVEKPAAPAVGILLGDFENPEEDERLLKTWQVATEVKGGGKSLGEFEVISPGAGGSGHALRFQGRVESAPESPEGYVGARYSFTPPAGMSLRGLQFEVRGDARLFHATITPPDPSLPAPALAFIPDSAWQAVRLPMAWTAPPNPAPHPKEWVLEFRVDGPPGKFHLDIDELRLY